MKKIFYQKENIALVEEMFLSISKIIYTIRYSSMDKETLDRYLKFFYDRYKNVVGVKEFCEMMSRIFYHRYVFDEETVSLEKFTSFEELLLYAKTYNNYPSCEAFINNTHNIPSLKGKDIRVINDAEDMINLMLIFLIMNENYKTIHYSNNPDIVKDVFFSFNELYSRGVFERISNLHCMDTIILNTFLDIIEEMNEINEINEKNVI